MVYWLFLTYMVAAFIWWYVTLVKQNDQIANEMGDKIKVCKINIDDNPETPSKFGIRSIPTLMIFQGGKVIATKMGSLPKSALVEWINSEIA